MQANNYSEESYAGVASDYWALAARWIAEEWSENSWNIVRNNAILCDTEHKVSPYYYPYN